MEMYFAFVTIAFNNLCFKPVRLVVCGEYIPIFGHHNVCIDVVITA